jgi:hypothetical protein
MITSKNTTEGGEPMGSKKPKPPPEPEIDEFSALEDPDLWCGIAETFRQIGPDGTAHDLATILETCCSAIEKGQPQRAVDAMRRGVKMCFRHTEVYQLCRRLWMFGLTEDTLVSDELDTVVKDALERCGVKIKEDRYAG